MIQNQLPLFVILLGFSISTWAWGNEITLYIGTGGKKAEGIYHTTFNQQTGQFSDVSLASKINSPGFIARHPSLTCLYAVARWKNQAGVVGYKIGKDQKLEEFTRMVCTDGMGCHLAVHPSGKFLLTAQYAGGSVGFFPLNEKGELKEPSIFEHSGGSKVFGTRQDSPHPHWCGYSPCGKFALIPDLGLDQIVLYKIDLEEIKMSPHGIAKSLAGGGPRHMRFSTNQKWIYLLNELSLSVEVFSWDSQLGKAKSLSNFPTLTETEKIGESFNSAAEILVHPSGKWIYSSNRGHDSVTVFSTNPDGSLKIIQKQPIRGAFPRNINLTPSGKWLLAAGQDSNTVAAHRVDPASGKLTYQRGAMINVPQPICLFFLNK